MAVTDRKREQIVGDLSPVLQPGEQILEATTCVAHVVRMNQKTTRRATLAVTDRRVVIFSKKLGGYDLQDFAFGLLASVDQKNGLVFGHIRLQAAGSSIELQQVDKNSVEGIATLVRQKMAAAHNPGISGSGAAASTADEIRKLAELRDLGVLSAAEFTAQKAKLLA
jgi:hypothetical protein